MPDVIADIRGWGLINGVELSEKSGVTAAEVTKVRLHALKN
jgi:4-aminobutyrate aminotransferase-like enzyme